MRHLTRLSLLAAVVLGAAAFTSPAFGARPSAMQLPNTIGTAHFLVHFQSAAAVPGAITLTQAGDIASIAERAYSAEVADGYPTPPSDGALGGDGRIDIYVDDLSGTGYIGLTFPDTGSSPDSAYILLDGAKPELGLAQHNVAHELFHVFQVGIWYSSQVSDHWLYEGSAEWMGYRVDGYAGNFDLGPDDMSLDCRDPIGAEECDTDPYLGNGYSRWPFFEYLAEKYGTSFMKDIFALGQSGAPTATAALANALAAKGTTLADTFDAWTTVEMTGGYTVTPLQGYKPTPYTTIQTGPKTATLPVQRVSLNHLASRFLEFKRGDGDASEACFRATLSLVVAMPPGTLSKPTFYWDGTGSVPVPLTINGNTASASIPWSTCTGSGEAFLSLQNASLNVEAADFVVNTSVSVDTTTPASATAPPDAVSLWGDVVPVPSIQLPPTIAVYGPELLTLSPAATQIRVIVESSGDGLLQATIGSTPLGSGVLRAGNNDIRFTLPPSLRLALRRSADVSNVLTLTPVATSGGAQGQPMTRKVLIKGVKPVKKPTAPKPKPKLKPKTKGHK